MVVRESRRVHQDLSLRVIGDNMFGQSWFVKVNITMRAVYSGLLDYIPSPSEGLRAPGPTTTTPNSIYTRNAMSHVRTR